MKEKQGFTLLEVVIVIVIIGVLTSLALPRLFLMVERSRASEAIAIISTLRSAMERCYLRSYGSYEGCGGIPACSPGPNCYWVNLDISFENDPNQHFGYPITETSKDGYRIRALRNTHEYSGPIPRPTLDCRKTVDRFYCQGTGIYSNIKFGSFP